MRSLEEIEARAVRHLDGSRVNMDAMARDVIDLVSIVRSLQTQGGGVEKATEAIRTTLGCESAVASALPKQFSAIFGPDAVGA